MERIVVGVDGSEGAQAALAWAVAEGALRQATVQAVAVWDTPVLVASPASPTPVDVIDPELYRQATRTVLDEAVDAMPAPGLPGPVERIELSGPAGDALVEQAKDAALLVVGSSGHGGIMGALLGSVSHHCVHHATCPVVVVPKRH